MTKKLKNLLKRVGKAYLDGYMRLYGPAINCKVNPYI